MDSTSRAGSPGEGAGPAPLPIDFTYRFAHARPKPFFVPKDPDEAELYLRIGNELIVRFHEACKRRRYHSDDPPSIVEISEQEAVGEPRGDDGLPKQMPFALMLGCANARVPTELLFGQEFNDIFNIRVAGNVLFEEGIGSLLYALRSFVAGEDRPDHRSLKLAGALGHRGCGAVRAAITAMLEPDRQSDPLDKPIDSILCRIAAPPLAIAVESLAAVFGPGAERQPEHFLNLIELTVYLNAAWVSHQIREWVDRAGPAIAPHVGVVYGVFDPNDWRVRPLPPVAGEVDTETFGSPPADEAALRELGLVVAERLAQTHFAQNKSNI